VHPTRATVARFHACSLTLEKLAPGPLLWLAHSPRKLRRTNPRLFQPVLLTILTPEEQERPLKTMADLKRLKLRCGQGSSHIDH